MIAKQKELDENRKKELKELREKLGVHEFIESLQSYSKEKGDYTEGRREFLKNITIEDFEKFLKENKQ